MKCVNYSEKVSDKENTEKFASNRPRLDTEHNTSPYINLVWIKKFLCRIKTMSADESWSVEHPFQNSYQREREREALYCFWLPKRKNQIWCTGPLYASQAKLFMDHKTEQKHNLILTVVIVVLNCLLFHKQFSNPLLHMSACHPSDPSVLGCL